MFPKLCVHKVHETCRVMLVGSSMRTLIAPLKKTTVYCYRLHGHLLVGSLVYCSGTSVQTSWKSDMPLAVQGLCKVQGLVLVIEHTAKYSNPATGYETSSKTMCSEGSRSCLWQFCYDPSSWKVS